MTAERKRKPVFQESGSESPVETDPPFQSGEENLDDILGAQSEPEPEASVEEPAPVLPAEPETQLSEDALPNGWRVISAEQQDGKHFVVTHDLNAQGMHAYWRKTRVMSHFRWVTRGKWSDSLTRQDILPEPRYYKEV